MNPDYCVITNEEEQRNRSTRGGLWRDVPQQSSTQRQTPERAREREDISNNTMVIKTLKSFFSYRILQNNGKIYIHIKNENNCCPLCIMWGICDPPLIHVTTVTKRLKQKPKNNNKWSWLLRTGRVQNWIKKVNVHGEEAGSRQRGYKGIKTLI